MPAITPSLASSGQDMERMRSEGQKKALIEAAREWGYFKGAIKTRKDLWRGKRMLDVGMGAGPHAISFIEGGAAEYVGVDPLIGSTHVRDFRNQSDPSIPAYHSFPFSTQEIMRIYPEIHLYSGFMEDVVSDLKAHKIDIAIMGAVTEHLRQPDKVIEGIWDILQPSGDLWISHCNYYSWTGHHLPPRSVASWDSQNSSQNEHVDWKHLEPTHPKYNDPNLNRVRLDDLRLAIAKYFEIVEWTISVEGLSRLTPELRKKWKKYSLAELLGRNIFITGRRRDQPLDTDLSHLQLHHPDEGYQADHDYSGEDIAPYSLCNSVFFSKNNELCSHSDNDHAALRVFERLVPGDRIVVSKFVSRLTFTVDSVVQPSSGHKRVKLVEPVPTAILDSNHDQWAIEI